MHQNKIWILFLCLTVVAMAWFSSRAFSKVQDYRHLSKQIPAEVVQWEIKQGKGDTYTVTANYFFEFGGRTYQGASPVTKPYKNPWSAKKAVGNFEQKNWVAWVDPNKPAQSTLYKKFPSKLVSSTVALVVLVVYFVVLGIYVGRNRHGHRT